MIDKIIYKEITTNLESLGIIEKEMSMYFVDKTLKYKEYLINDIKNDNLPLQNKVIESLNNEIEIDGEKVNFKEYLFANMESEISNKINELVDLIMKEKYNSIIVLYDTLVKKLLLIIKIKMLLMKKKLIYV